METSVKCYSRGILLLSVSSQRSSTLVSPPSFSASSSFKSDLISALSEVELTLRRFTTPSTKIAIESHQGYVKLVKSWKSFFREAAPETGLRTFLMCMGEALRTIAFKVMTASCGGTACVNSFVC